MRRALALLVVGVLAAGCSDGHQDQREPASPDQLPASGVLRVATFNVLGSNHTAGDGDGVKAWGTGVERVPGIVERLESFAPDLLGIQEFQDAQKAALFAEVGDTFGYHGELDNGVMWRRSTFTKLSSTFVTIPYFRGKPKRMPVVRLRLKETGDVITLLGVHNPADVGHDASAYRDQAVMVERRFVARERAKGRVVFLVGDLNAHEEAYCPLARGGLLVSANGGSYEAGECTPPDETQIDWILGAGAEFSGYASDGSTWGDEVSDHPFVVATVSKLDGGRSRDGR